MSLKGHLRLQKNNFTLDTGEFEIPVKGVTAIFGHSGSGKTTFLRCLAGLEKDAMGVLTVASDKHHPPQTWLNNAQSMPVHKRKLGYVFQEASLFAHLNVEKNLRYGLKRAKIARFIEFKQVVEWLGLATLLNRDVQTLSGGERQRVAIGRTLLSQPTILMMDEPMAALDLFSKRSIMPYLEKLRDALDIPILYISHSPEEVERLADTVVFMAQGKITEIEPISEALNRRGTPLYQIAEPRSVMAAKVIKHCEEDALTLVKSGDASLWVPRLSEAVGETVRVLVAAQNVSLMFEVPQQTTILNHLKVRIETIEPFNETSLLLRLKVGTENWPLLAQVTKRSVNKMALTEGVSLFAAIKSASILS